MVTPITSDVPTPKALVNRARALIPTLIERAPAQQANRRILNETMAILVPQNLKPDCPLCRAIPYKSQSGLPATELSSA